jgi:hypothetical protein
MTWLAWRQHRSHLLAALSAVVVLAGTYAWARVGLESYLHGSGLAACLARPDEGCGNVIGGLRAMHPSVLEALPYLNLAPVAAGLFWGAPLVAGEVEKGTHRLVWTQAISSARWLWTKVMLVAAACVVFGIVIGALDRWFLDPYIRASAISPVAPNYVGLLGVAPAAYALFAFTLGTAVGTFVHRVLPAMTITLAIFAPIRVIWEQQRYRLLSPVRVAYQLTAARPANAGRQDWRLDTATSLIDHAGHAVTQAQVSQWCASSAGDGVKGSGLAGCLAQRGIQQLEWYEPAGRFWHLQALDASIFVALAAVLIAVAALRVSRRLD